MWASLEYHQGNTGEMFCQEKLLAKRGSFPAFCRLELFVSTQQPGPRCSSQQNPCGRVCIKVGRLQTQPRIPKTDLCEEEEDVIMVQQFSDICTKERGERPDSGLGTISFTEHILKISNWILNGLQNSAQLSG